MSNGTGNGEGQSTGSEGKPVNVEEVLKRFEQLESSYNRVLEESKSHKSKAQEYKSKLDEIEKKGIEQSGDVQKQIEYERRNREEKEKENKKLKASILQQRLKDRVAKYAKDVHDLDDFLNKPAFSHILKSGINEDTLEIDDNAVKDYSNKVLERYPYLKKNTDQAGVDTQKPNAKTAGKDYSKMTSKEIAEAIKNGL